VTDPTAPAPVPASTRTGPTPAARGTRLPLVLAVWTVALVAGFALVLGLGRPVATAADEIAAAYRPVPPVSAAAARTSADTIVRLEYPDFQGVEPEVSFSTSYGIERHVLVYSRPEILSGVRVSIEVASGDVTVTTFP
jgi:hypothetical protein